MANYRLTSIDLSTRVSLALEMLTPIGSRPWGYVSRKAEELEVCRTWLYQLRNRALEALITELRPRQRGPAPCDQSLIVDRDFVQYAIVVLALVKGSVRGIAQALELLFGVKRSIGHISQTLQSAGAKAEQINVSVEIPHQVLAEADEIFAANRPCLTVVDGKSFLVLNLKAQHNRDATTWGCTFLDLHQQGICFHDIASDGARGITAGVKETQMAIPLRLDLFHVLREATKVSARLERRGYKAMELTDRVKRAEAESGQTPRRRGRPLKVEGQLGDAQAIEHDAVYTYDAFDWLVSQVRAVLEPISPTGQFTQSHCARDTICAAAQLMGELEDKKAKAFGRLLENNLDGLIAPIIWLNEMMRTFVKQHSRLTLQFIGWAWRNRDQLELCVASEFSASLQPTVCSIFRLLEMFHRTSSLAECFHSWLRPYLTIHRGMPQWLLSLLQLYWNHHLFGRGKRAGFSPVQLAQGQQSQTLQKALARVCCS